MADSEVHEVHELQSSIDVVPVPVVISSATSRDIVAVNSSACDEFRWSHDKLIQMRVDDLTHPHFRPELTANYMRSSAAGGFSTLKRYVRSDGSSFMGRLRAAPTPGQPELLTAVVTNIEETDEMRSEVLAAATVDELTGALRRGAFLDAVRLAASIHSGYGLLFIDLDGMKQINDELGHAAGDAALIALSRRLQASIRHGDLVGRFGGDEFVVFVNDVLSSSQLALIAGTLAERIHEPVEHDGTTFPLSASIGAAVCSHEVDPEAAVAAADAAMYEAKRSRRAGDLSPIHEDAVVRLSCQD